MGHGGFPPGAGEEAGGVIITGGGNNNNRGGGRPPGGRAGAGEAGWDRNQMERKLGDSVTNAHT